jgi:hypothetical protein
LLDEIDMVFGGFSWTQRIDYWRVPFRSYDCHEVGHLFTQCHRSPSQFSLFKKSWKRKAEAEVAASEKVVEGKKDFRKSP